VVKTDLCSCFDVSVSYSILLSFHLFFTLVFRILLSPTYVFRNPTVVIVQNYQDALGVRMMEMLAVIFLVASIKKMVRLATKSCIVIRLPVHVNTLSPNL